MNLMGYNITRQ